MRMASVETTVAQRQALLDRANALQAAGFGDDALTRLGEVLAGASQVEGKPTAEVVPAFLDAAADRRRLGELRGQGAVAENAAQEAAADCRRREREAKVRSAAVDWAVWLVRRKITAETLSAWQVVAAKLGIDAETLATGLARALEAHGSLEAARQALSAAVARLRADLGKLTGDVAALRRERDGLSAAIGAVRDSGIAQVREVAEAATAEVRRAAGGFERLQTQAAELAKHVRMAQALASEDQAMWERVEPQTWAGLLAHILRWADARLVAGIDVEPLEPVEGRLEDQVRYSYTKGPVRLTPPQLVSCWPQGSKEPRCALPRPSWPLHAPTMHASARSIFWRVLEQPRLIRRTASFVEVARRSGRVHHPDFCGCRLAARAGPETPLAVAV